MTFEQAKLIAEILMQILGELREMNGKERIV